MDFDPTPKILRSQKEVDEYLANYGVRLSSNGKAEWCPVKTDYTMAPKRGSIYLHPQILALGMKFLLTSFIRDLLHYFKVTPSQLVAGSWRIVLSFEALCDLFAHDSRRVEDFSALYVMRKTKEN